MPYQMYVTPTPFPEQDFTGRDTTVHPFPARPTGTGRRFFRIWALPQSFCRAGFAGEDDPGYVLDAGIMTG